MSRRISVLVSALALAATTSLISVSASNAVAPEPPSASCSPTYNPQKYAKWGENCGGWRIWVNKKSPKSTRIGFDYSGLESVWYGNGHKLEPWNSEFKFNEAPLVLGQKSGWGGPMNVDIPFVSKFDDENILASDWQRFIIVRSVADFQAARAQVRCGVFKQTWQFFDAFRNNTAVDNIGCKVLDRVDERTGEPVTNADTTSGRIDPTKSIRVEFQEVEDGEWKQH